MNVTIRDAWIAEVQPEDALDGDLGKLAEARDAGRRVIRIEQKDKMIDLFHMTDPDHGRIIVWQPKPGDRVHILAKVKERFDWTQPVKSWKNRLEVIHDSRIETWNSGQWRDSLTASEFRFLGSGKWHGSRSWKKNWDAAAGRRIEPSTKLQQDEDGVFWIMQLTESEVFSDAARGPINDRRISIPDSPTPAVATAPGDSAAGPSGARAVLRPRPKAERAELAAEVPETAPEIG